MAVGFTTRTVLALSTAVHTTAARVGPGEGVVSSMAARSHTITRLVSQPDGRRVELNG
jgi:hypothetical protein